jgi:hypothetical protein
MKRLVGRAAIAVAAVTGLVLGFGASPASAHPISWGWSDNHTLCAASWCVRNGNVVRLWQSILWVDGYDNGQNTAFIDGGFGNNTHGQTLNWQSRYVGSGGVDGEVGPMTWGAASRFCDDWISGSYLYATYCGDPAAGSRSFQMRQNRSTGVWEFVNPRTGAWTGTSH